MMGGGLEPKPGKLYREAAVRGDAMDHDDRPVGRILDRREVLALMRY